MKHRSDYRIVKVHKEGYYTFYTVQRKKWKLFWVDLHAGYNSVEEALSWINNETTVEVREVVL